MKKPNPNCWRCGEAMYALDGVANAYICRCSAALVEGKMLGCDCGYCQERSAGSRIHALLQETGLFDKGARLSQDFLKGPAGYGEGI